MAYLLLAAVATLCDGHGLRLLRCNGETDHVLRERTGPAFPLLQKGPEMRTSVFSPTCKDSQNIFRH